MKVRLLAAAALAVGLVTPAFAQGIDSRHDPESAAAFLGFAGNVSETLPELAVTHSRPAPAYRYSDQHAGSPADARTRY